MPEQTGRPETGESIMNTDDKSAADAHATIDVETAAALDAALGRASRRVWRGWILDQQQEHANPQPKTRTPLNGSPA
jgi:hypothetical protein